MRFLPIVAMPPRSVDSRCCGSGGRTSRAASRTGGAAIGVSRTGGASSSFCLFHIEKPPYLQRYIELAALRPRRAGADHHKYLYHKVEQIALRHVPEHMPEYVTEMSRRIVLALSEPSAVADGSRACKANQTNPSAPAEGSDNAQERLR